MSDHGGHRERIRERFRREGLDSFTDIQVLELLLFYCIPRKDTNPIAHGLLDHFGSLSQVLEAPVEELCKVEGIGESAAVFLKLIPQAGRYYMNDRASQMKLLPTLESCAAYLTPRFIGRTVEMVFLLCLDAKCKVLCCRKIAEGEFHRPVPQKNCGDRPGGQCIQRGAGPQPPRRSGHSLLGGSSGHPSDRSCPGRRGGQAGGSYHCCR